MDERELLEAYAETGDQEAFARLVRGNGDWVYAAARRQLGDEHLAEDVTQAVFLLLVQRAGRLRKHPKLGGWLFGSLGYCVRHVRRQRVRQERREREAAEMRREKHPRADEASWDEIAVVLDDAVAGLRPADREMVLMRFYRGMSFAEVGKVGGIGEEAAKKRVQRAVEKLRGVLEKKGVRGTTAGLSAVLVGNVGGQMPDGLVGRIVSAVGSGGGSTAAAAIAKGAMKMMTYAKMKVVAGILALSAAAGGVTWATGGGSGTSAPAPAVATAPPQMPAQTPADSSAPDAAVHRIKVILPDGTPASGAEVYLPRQGSDSLWLEDPVSRLGQRGPTSRPTAEFVTGSGGWFDLPRDRQWPKMAIIHQLGVVEVTPDDTTTGQVQLQAWARIEGQLSPTLRGGQGQKARYFSNRMGIGGTQLCYAMDVPVDGQGKFTIEHVPPGGGVVGRYLALTVQMTDMNFLTHGVAVRVAPGNAATVAVGGTGVNVSGNVKPPPGAAWDLADKYAYVSLVALPSAKGPKFPTVPDEVRKMSVADQKAWFIKWAKTPEGKAWMAEYESYQMGSVRTQYANGIRADGVFELPEVEPGRYRLTLSVCELSRAGWNEGKQLGTLSREIVVPDKGKGQTADIGTFTLQTPEEARAERERVISASRKAASTQP